MVGAVRFELTTSCTRNKRATRLRYAPTLSRRKWRVRRQFAIEFSLFLYWVSDLRPRSLTGYLFFQRHPLTGSGLNSGTISSFVATASMAWTASCTASASTASPSCSASAVMVNGGAILTV